MAARAHNAYVALGANLGDPPAQLREALDQLARAPGVELMEVSGFYRTPPLGPPGQPDYCNAACRLDTTLEPEALLDLLQAIEARAGRIRTAEQWGPRMLDLDLLHVDGVELHTPRLTLPHPRLHERAFVLVPLAEVAPDLFIPSLGAVAALLAGVDRSAITHWS